MIGSQLQYSEVKSIFLKSAISLLSSYASQAKMQISFGREFILLRKMQRISQSVSCTPCPTSYLKASARSSPSQSSKFCLIFSIDTLHFLPPLSTFAYSRQFTSGTRVLGNRGLDAMAPHDSSGYFALSQAAIVPDTFPPLITHRFFSVMPKKRLSMILLITQAKSSTICQRERYCKLCRECESPPKGRDSPKQRGSTAIEMAFFYSISWVRKTDFCVSARGWNSGTYRNTGASRRRFDPSTLMNTLWKKYRQSLGSRWSTRCLIHANFLPTVWLYSSRPYWQDLPTTATLADGASLNLKAMRMMAARMAPTTNADLTIFFLVSFFSLSLGTAQTTRDAASRVLLGWEAETSCNSCSCMIRSYQLITFYHQTKNSFFCRRGGHPSERRVRDRQDTVAERLRRIIS